MIKMCIGLHVKYRLFLPGFNPLNPELNPICYLLALLAHHFLHVSKIRVKSLTLRLLMSYIRGLLEKYPTFGREKETGLLGALDT